MPDRNTRLYLWFACLSHAMAWLPVYFLYLNTYVSLAEFVRLQAFYYISVVILEVPSGYFSDRIGRKITLVLSQVFLVTAYGLFIIGDGFAVFMIAEFFVAAGVAFMSGTDSAFLYDSLKSAGREAEYGDYEARATYYSMICGAAAVLAGGLVTALLPAGGYVLSLVTAAGAVAVALMFVEPGAVLKNQVASFPVQLRICAAAIVRPLAAWLALFTVTMFMLAHVPFEFYQAYVKLADLSGRLPAMSAPVYSAILFALTMLISAWPAGQSIRWQRRIGLVRFLLAAGVVQVAIIAVMASALHWLLALVVLFRNLPMTLVHAPVHAALAPLIASEYRATYLSLQNLLARLAFGLFLAALSTGVDTTTWPGIRQILVTSVLVGLILLAVLLTMARFNRAIGDSELPAVPPDADGAA